jgi:ubiquinone/menaquinone biosynthesis C-methylase UbiE
MAPPRARDFVLGHLAAFDDEALRTFLAPGDWGVDPRRLGIALQGEENDDLASRVARALPAAAREGMEGGRAAYADSLGVERARRHVVNRLFWALLYWHDPAGYEELVAGEHIHSELLDSIPLRDRIVADLGCGAGRFTLFAARHARHVIGVDAVPALLERLTVRAREEGLDNIEVRRGDFCNLPLDDACVDIAVACSSLTSHAPWGGDDALDEARRIVRPGGDVVVIWPDDPSWFTARGFAYIAMTGNDELHFADAATAERVCRSFYSEKAAAWVRAHGSAKVPFTILGVSPPNDACILRVGAAVVAPPEGERHQHPGVELG